LRQDLPSPKGYRPLVGVVVDAASSFGRAILRGVMRYANLQRSWVIHEDLWRAVESMHHWPRCDGCILSGVTPDVFDLVRQRSRHAIFCSGSADPSASPVVQLNDEEAGAMAARHLIECRLERFAFYGRRPGVGGISVASKRLAGFRAAVEARGFSVQECPIDWPSGTEWLTHAHHPALIKWLRNLNKPVGILAVDDMAGHDLAGACLEGNIPVPDQAAIVGVNNDDLLCEASWPPLSSVEADYSRVGYLAAKQLDRLLNNEALPRDEWLVRVPPLGVVQRQSTSILAVSEPNLADAIRFIREHACDPCTVHDVLREVPVGRRWLERQFTAQLGRTPHDEIARVRVETAKRLLLQPDLSLPEIADRCGYSATQNFERQFRHVTGVTPAAYRRTALRGAGAEPR
jgi:LacI family transcriptional regulator